MKTDKKFYFYNSDFVIKIYGVVNIKFAEGTGWRIRMPVASFLRNFKLMPGPPVEQPEMVIQGA